MRTRTIDNIVADIQERAGLSTSDGFTSQNTALEFANQSYQRLRNKLIQADPTYFIKDGTPFQTVGGTTLYNLDDTIQEMVNVSISYGGFNRTIKRFMPKEQPRWSETTVPGGITVNYRFIPSAARLTLGTNALVDGVAGFEEWIVLDSTIKALAREESDASEWIRQRADIDEEIALMAQNRDDAWPDRVTDVYENRQWGFTLGVPRYRIQGQGGGAHDQIEILWGPLPGIAFFT